MNVIYLLSAFLNVIWLLLIVYFILSWFPLNPSGFPAQVKGMLHQLFDPVLSFIRRFVPPIGIIDTAGLVLIFTIFILQNILASLS